CSTRESARSAARSSRTPSADSSLSRRSATAGHDDLVGGVLDDRADGDVLAPAGGGPRRLQCSGQVIAQGPQVPHGAVDVFEVMLEESDDRAARLGTLALEVDDAADLGRNRGPRCQGGEVSREELQTAGPGHG